MRNTGAVCLLVVGQLLAPRTSAAAPQPVAPEITQASDRTSDNAESKVYKPGDAVTPPRAIKSPDPRYSKEAAKKKIQGVVVVAAVIGPDGFVKDVRVVHGLGYGLDEEAVKTVRRWRFQPALKDGTPVAYELGIECHFRMRW